MYKGKQFEKHGFDLDITEIAKRVKKELNTEGLKWSVTTERFAGGQSINVHLLEAPFEVFTEEFINEKNKKYTQVNTHNVENADYLTEKGKLLMKRARQVTESYNYDDSDPRTDYYNVNFYSHYEIGKYDRPFKVVDK